MIIADHFSVSHVNPTQSALVINVGVACAYT